MPTPRPAIGQVGGVEPGDDGGLLVLVGSRLELAGEPPRLLRDDAHDQLGLVVERELGTWLVAIVVVAARPGRP